MAISLFSVSLFDWSHEGSKLIRDDPVHVTVFDTLIKLVLFDDEGFELVPAELQSPLKALQAMVQRALVHAVSLTSISVRSEEVSVWL